MNRARLGVVGLVVAAAGVMAPARAADPPASRRELDARAIVAATEVRLAPSRSGAVGAWLVAGPFRAAKSALEIPPAGVDEANLRFAAGAVLPGEREPAQRGAPARWTLVSSSDGPIDLKGALGSKGTDLVAYAAGVLHVPAPGRYLLALGVDDGVRVIVDGKTVLSRDEARAFREDDDVVPLDLAAGDHPVVLKLHQRDGAWVFRARVTASNLTPVPGVHLFLPGTTADDARTLAGAMATVSLERTLDPVRAHYRPTLSIRYPEGVPLGVERTVSARLLTGKDPPALELQLGAMPVDASGAADFVASLPPVTPKGSSTVLETTIAGRQVRASFPARPLSEAAIVRATRALETTPAGASWLEPASLDTVRFLLRRLTALVARGDQDAEAQRDEARELDGLAASLERQRDPFTNRTGPMRRALRSAIDGEPSEFGLYVPPSLRPGSARRYPLVVALHGLNGQPMEMLRWIFGGDDPKRDGYWEDRHLGTLPPAEAVIVAPFAHGSTLYRELGEADVMQILAWATARYPIDPARITITGPSMGGIGAASIPLHFPHRFAGALPLCGYHSYFVRRDVVGRPMRPWETFLAEERSNALWAENGEHLPMWIVHGTQDLPEENSGALIERYEKLGFSMKHDHPDRGHNVWQETYEGLVGLNWLQNRRLDLQPSHVRFKTSRTRWSTSAWVSVDELASETGWGEVDARIRGRKAIGVTTSGVRELSLTPGDAQVDRRADVQVTIDGQVVSFAPEEPLVLRKEGTWTKGRRPAGERVKRGTITGPIRDVFYEPLMFVYADDPEEARAAEQVARSLARIRGGVRVAYPVLSDGEFFGRGEPLGNDKALVLVGRTNRVAAALAKAHPQDFPIRVDAGGVTMGSERFTGREVGAAYVRPNPEKPSRYVLVVAGADVPGLLRATSLPDLLPDFVVWDEGVARARGQVILGSAYLRAAGFFTMDWSLPRAAVDPYAARFRGPARPDERAPAGPESSEAP